MSPSSRSALGTLVTPFAAVHYVNGRAARLDVLDSPGGRVVASHFVRDRPRLTLPKGAHSCRRPAQDIPPGIGWSP